VFGVATVVFGLSRNFGLSLCAGGFRGRDSISVVTRSTLVQLDTPNHMRGRVSAVNSMFIGASNQLGNSIRRDCGTVWCGWIGGTGGVGTVLIACGMVAAVSRLGKAGSDGDAGCDLKGTGRYHPSVVTGDNISQKFVIGC